MDWLSRLLDLVPIQGRLDIRCAFSAPWRIDHEAAAIGEIQYHVIVAGRAVLQGLPGQPSQHLEAGDILILTDGGAHLLRDGGRGSPTPIRSRSAANIVIKENHGSGAALDMLCGRFLVSTSHDRLLRAYLPPRLIVRAGAGGMDGMGETGTMLSHLIQSMRAEAESESLGARAILNALSSALFTLALRFAAETSVAPKGLLALAGNPRLAPAVAALFNDPANTWTLPALAALCHMSRASFARNFQASFGRSANDLQAEIRMTLAAQALERPGASTASVASSAGYQSDAAFQRAFKQRMGVTAAQWRRSMRASDRNAQ